MAPERMTPVRCTVTGASLIQRPMRSETVVIVSVRFQDPTQMRFATDDYVIETLAPDRSDQPFGNAILPGRGGGKRVVRKAHGSQSAGDDRALESIAITGHVTPGNRPKKSPGS